MIGLCFGMHVAKVLPKQVREFSENRSKIFGKNDLGKKTILVWNKNAYQNGFKLKLSDSVRTANQSITYEHFDCMIENLTGARKN